MREIKFRGKAICDYEQFGVIGIKKNTWVYGYYYKDVKETNDFKYISYIRMLYGDHYVDIEAVPETIGEYTGVKDDNGIEIFENDIVRYYGGEFCQGYWEYDGIYVVKKQSNNFDLISKNKCGRGWGFYEGDDYIIKLGNTYDNSELLKV